MRIAIVCGLMYVFLILYAFYFFINSIKCLAARDERIMQKKGFIWNRKKRARSDEHKVDFIDLSMEDSLAETVPASSPVESAEHITSD
jgi:hypothetical protein